MYSSIVKNLSEKLDFSLEYFLPITLLICFLSYAVIKTILVKAAFSSINLKISIISSASNLSRSSMIIMTLFPNCLIAIFILSFSIPLSHIL